jgi:predicted lipoprotein with Yx(FWY)xxD motif
MLQISRSKFFNFGALTVVASLALAACAPAAAPVVAPAAMPAASSAYSQPTKAVVPVTGSSVTINTAKDDKLGTFLVDGNGMTLYLFTKDTPGVSNCNAGCLAKWPALEAENVSQVKVGTGVDATKLGLADLSNGKKIVTYNGMPLYYWVNDKKPGDVTGQNVGGVWFVVAP